VLHVDDLPGIHAAMAELRAEHHAALGLQARRERGVIVRREVEIVRRGHVEAAVARRAEYWREEAGHPAIVDREADPWRVEDRHVLDAQRHVRGGAAAARAVEF